MIEKQGYLIETEPTEKFIWNNRSTRVSGPQLEIKNQILPHRWIFRKDPLKSVDDPQSNMI